MIKSEPIIKEELDEVYVKNEPEQVEEASKPKVKAKVSNRSQEKQEQLERATPSYKQSTSQKKQEQPTLKKRTRKQSKI